ncbi:MAG: class I mannose-6-phosphate isomerase [Terriglobales bacterium]
MSGFRIVEPVFKPRVWGSVDLSAWFPGRNPGAEPIGEAWLSPKNCPVLIKLLFPRERVSVQVHPDDAWARAHGLACGKSEAWYVLAAEGGAQVAAGLLPGVSKTELEAACRAGRGASVLRWLPVAAGDVISIPAGTVHAIGGGMTLLEVQQPSDTTFRLDDYGRGRELHLEQGLEVARATEAGRIAHGLGLEQSGSLLATAHWQLWRHCVRGGDGGTVAPQPFARWLINAGEGGPIPKGHLAELAADAEFDTRGATTLLEVRPGATAHDRP